MKEKQNDDVVLAGGFGEKKSNKNTQWYIQDRIYSADGICPALTSYKSDYWIIIKKEGE